MRNTWSIEELNQALADPSRSLRSALEELYAANRRDFPQLDLGKVGVNTVGGPTRNDVLAIPCSVFPTSPTTTNQRFLFLREIGGPLCLKAFLESVIEKGFNSPHWGGTLVIDQKVICEEPIRIPSAFTLAGVGIHGAGQITFKGDFGATPAISCQENADGGVGGFSIIRDLTISGPDAPNTMGGIKLGTRKALDLEGNPKDVVHVLGRFQLRRVRVTRFGAFGVQGGMDTYTVLIDQCELVGNRVNIQLIEQCNAWRIRDCLIVGATAWGVDIGASIVIDGVEKKGGLSNTLISGCRLRGNAPGAVRTVNSHALMAFGNRFEANTVAVKVVNVSGMHRIVANVFEKDEVLSVPKETHPQTFEPSPMGTHLGFNVSPDEPINRIFVPLPE